MNESKIAALPGDPELERVCKLARSEPVTDEFRFALSRHLSRPGSDCELRIKQAQALRDLYLHGGAFGNMPTGEGKTLVTLLAPMLLGASSPVLVLPAADREKCCDEFREYLADGWYVRLPQLLSYDLLSTDRGEQLLWSHRPDLLEFDEVDMIARNLDSGRGRKARRFIERAPMRPRVVVLSGTLISDALLDYWEVLVWALQSGAPVPLDRDRAELWASALDATLSAELRRAELGALADIEGGFHAWLRNTPGVISGRGEQCPAEIRIAPWMPPQSDTLREAIAAVERSHRRPDGEPLDEWELPDCQMQLAQGFYQIWDPMPPAWWLLPRRAWYAYERAVLDAQLDGFDTPGAVRRALDNPRRQPQPPAATEGRVLLAAWREVEPRFVPNDVTVWITGEVMDAAAEHAHRHPGTVVWVENVGPGLELQRRGLPYYGAGTRPDRHTGGGSICAGMSHARGKNLQRVSHRGLVLHLPASARRWEQMIARQHRPGQTRPVVEYDVIATIPRHGQTLQRVLKRAHADAIAGDVPQKLTIAKWA